jgi:hypothetical protein
MALSRLSKGALSLAMLATAAIAPTAAYSEEHSDFRQNCTQGQQLLKCAGAESRDKAIILGQGNAKDEAAINRVADEMRAYDQNVEVVFFKKDTRAAVVFIDQSVAYQAVIDDNTDWDKIKGTLIVNYRALNASLDVGSQDFASLEREN